MIYPEIDDWEEIRKFAETFTKGPLITLYIAWIFRKSISDLVGRIDSGKLTIPGHTLEINNRPETTQLLDNIEGKVKPTKAEESVDDESDDEDQSDVESPDEDVVDDDV